MSLWRRLAPDAPVRRDLPFERDQSTRYLPWIVAPMVFLGVMAVATVMLIRDVTGSWDNQVAGSLTIQVPPDDDEALADRVDRAVAFAIAVPQIAAAVPVDAATTHAMLEPWLGAAAGDLPLPAIIEVTLVPRTRLDTEDFGARLAEQVPGALVDDHRVWLESLVDLADLVMTLALGALALVAASAAASIVYATRSGLAVHRGIIDLLHYMGAQDDYIARQFQHHVMSVCSRGGAVGAGLAAACLGALLYVGRGIDSAFLPPLALSGWQWAVLALVPVVAVIAAVVTTRLTVLRALAKLP